MPTRILPTIRLAALLGLASLAAIPSTRAVSLEPASVVSGDTFSLEVIGYNTNNPAGDVFLTTTNLQPTFGSTNSFANGALGGQTLTVDSVEYTNSGVVYDLINISVPTNFVPSGTRDNAGNTIDAVQFGIGDFFSLSHNTLDYNQPLTAYSVEGSTSFIFNGRNASQVVPMTTTLTNGNQSLTTYGSIFASPQGTGDISNNQVNAFTILVTYAVPEPSTYAMLALGVAGLFLAIRRRRARL